MPIYMQQLQVHVAVQDATLLPACETSLNWSLLVCKLFYLASLSQLMITLNNLKVNFSDFVNLNYQIGTGTCLEILLFELESCMGAVIIGFLCLPPHQSASVKSSTAGVLTSTLQSLPPGSFFIQLSLFGCSIHSLSPQWACMHRTGAHQTM